MSGTSYDVPCPVCGESMSCYSDWKPFDAVNGECAECGFYFYTRLCLANKTELKDIRENWESCAEDRQKYKAKKKDYKKEIKRFEKTWGYKLERV